MDISYDMKADNEKRVIARCRGPFQLALATSIPQKGSSRAISASKDLATRRRGLRRRKRAA